LFIPDKASGGENVKSEERTKPELKKPILKPGEKRVIKNIPVNKLFVGELNERIDVGDLTGLTASIKQVGILEPLLVRPVGDKFEIICGRRRFEAATLISRPSKHPMLRMNTDDPRHPLSRATNVISFCRGLETSERSPPLSGRPLYGLKAESRSMSFTA